MNFVAEGRKHDAGMLAESHLLDDLRQYALSLAGQPLCICGDPAYPIRVNLQCPFRNGVLTPRMEAYNIAMSSVRTSENKCGVALRRHNQLLQVSGL